MIKHYNIIIIGAGPAGAVCARMTTGKTIAILDRRPLGRDYCVGDLIKSCGGLLSPRSQKFLRKNNIIVPDYVLTTDQYNCVKTTDFDTNITRTYARDYINVDREKFDRFLLSDLPDNIDKYFDFHVSNIEYKNGLFIINNIISADILVGADGAGSIVRHKFFPNANFKKYVSIQQVYSTRLVSDYECYFDKSMGDYYGWALNKNGKTYFGYLINSGPNAAIKFEKFSARRGFEKSEIVQGALLIRPTFFHPILSQKNIFLIGEAGGWVSPSSAEGISFAMRMAKILATADYDLPRFRRGMRRIQFEIFVKKLKSIVMYTPWMRYLVMRFLPVGRANK